MCCHENVRSPLWSGCRLLIKGMHGLMGYASINYQGIWACSLITWKKSGEFYNSVILPTCRESQALIVELRFG